MKKRTTKRLTGTLTILQRFERAARAYEMRGSQWPDTAAGIEYVYHACKQELISRIKELEKRHV